MSFVLRKTVEGYLYEEFKYCGCGCRLTRPLLDNKGRKPKFIAGHQNRGKLNPYYGVIGENHPKFKQEICYGSIHDWAKRYVPKPNNCKICGQVKKLELSNISHTYQRDITDWQYVCRSCHRIFDYRRLL